MYQSRRANSRGNIDGKSEEVMGEAIRKFGWKRNDLVISTKVTPIPPYLPYLPTSIPPPTYQRTTPPLTHLQPTNPHPPKVYYGSAFGANPVNNRGLSRKHILEGTSASLTRLGLTYVDLLYAHRPDRLTPMEETVRAFNHLISSGQALYWGTSEWSADEIASAWRVADRLGLVGPLMEQPLYNLLDRERVEREYAHLYRETGLGLTVYSPMKSGMLTGKYTDGVPADSRFAQEGVEYIAGYWRRTGKEAWDANIARVNRLRPIAEQLGVTQGQLALAWVLRNPHVSSAITGASRPEQVYENVRALEVVDKLTPEILEKIDEILENKPPAIVERF